MLVEQQSGTTPKRTVPSSRRIRALSFPRYSCSPRATSIVWHARRGPSIALGNRLLARIGCLPNLRQVMPDVVGIKASRCIAGPRPNEFGPFHGDANDVQAAPVVPDEIDWLTNCLELSS